MVTIREIWPRCKLTGWYKYEYGINNIIYVTTDFIQQIRFVHLAFDSNGTILYAKEMVSFYKSGMDQCKLVHLRASEAAIVSEGAGDDLIKQLALFGLTDLAVLFNTLVRNKTLLFMTYSISGISLYVKF